MNPPNQFCCFFSFNGLLIWRCKDLATRIRNRNAARKLEQLSPSQILRPNFTERNGPRKSFLTWSKPQTLPLSYINIYLCSLSSFYDFPASSPIFHHHFSKFNISVKSSKRNSLENAVLLFPPSFTFAHLPNLQSTPFSLYLFHKFKLSLSLSLPLLLRILLILFI